MNRNFIVIENKTTGERFLLPWKICLKSNIPDGFVKRTTKIPLSEEYWKTVKDLHVYQVRE